MLVIFEVEGTTVNDFVSVHSLAAPSAGFVVAAHELRIEIHFMDLIEDSVLHVY